VPDGSAEYFNERVGWIGCNLEYPAEQWKAVRNRAFVRDIKVIPWIRLANQDDSATIVQEKLHRLVEAARAWKTDTILPNYENEADRIAPVEIEFMLKKTGWDGNTGFSMQGWLPNDPDYSPLAKYPVLLQIFPSDTRWPKDYGTIKQKMADCVKHARDKGFTYVGVTYQTYDGGSPAWYDCRSYQHSIFTGNLVTDWDAWFQ
jgi:hypothetical protein